MNRLDCDCSQSKLSITTKLRIYSTCVLPMLLYGSETWTLIQADWNKLDSFRVRCQRRILPSIKVLRRTDLFDVSYIVRKRRLGFFFGHVARLRRDVPTNQILQICTKTGMVSGLHRSGDAPVADHQPPGPIRSAATRV